MERYYNNLFGSGKRHSLLFSNEISKKKKQRLKRDLDHVKAVEVLQDYIYAEVPRRLFRERGTPFNMSEIEFRYDIIERKMFKELKTKIISGQFLECQSPLFSLSSP